MKAETSRTAWRAARHRAAHQLLEGGAIFFDPLAVPLLGEDPQKIMRETVERPDERLMRFYIAARSRYAEDCLARAVEDGMRQTVVLRAGFDTLGLRNPHMAKNLQVFEVDHPHRQASKRELLVKAGLDMPDNLHFVAVDIEQQDMLTSLIAAGFRNDAPAFFIWLGVVPHLTSAAIAATLSAIAGIPGAEVVFDYSEPLETFPEISRTWLDARRARAAALGEPWLSFFHPADLEHDLQAHGFAAIEDLGLGLIAGRYFTEATLPRDMGCVHLVHARK